MEIIKEQRFTGERAQFWEKDKEYVNCIFADGESPLKQAQSITLIGSSFQWKYPLWYAKDIVMDDCTVLEMGRAGIWYTDNIEIKNTLYEAPKGLRRIDGLKLRNVDMPHAEETLWSCKNVDIDGYSAKGDYLAMNCENVTINNMRLIGNYCFDGCKNVTVTNSKLLSKDAFWNCEHVVVKNCYITGEYLAWNSSDVTFIDCVIESLQGLCYVKGLKMINCKLVNTTYSFEYSECDVEVNSRIESVLNPASGVIKAEEIGNLIIEEDKIDPAKTQIICDRIEKRSDKPDWK